MSFEDIVNSKAKEQGFGSLRYIASYKERAHISKSKLDASSDCIYLKTKHEEVLKYDGYKSKRYVAAVDLGYDLLISVYEVNSGRLVVFRVFRPDNIEKQLGDAIRGFSGKKLNFEARIIGMQNGQQHLLLGRIIGTLKKSNVPLVEADLFGNEVRHITIDAKTGMSYNVLLEDRNYRPGELVNPMTVIDFERSLKAKQPTTFKAHEKAAAASPLPNPVEKR